MGKKKPTLEDHVNSIIAAGGPKGSLVKSYMCGFLEEVLDEVHSRDRLLDLRPYHFKKVLKIWKDEGRINYDLGRQATGELINTLKTKHKCNYEEVIRKISSASFHKEQIKYGAKIGGMLLHVYENSPSKAVIDYFQFHPSGKIRNRFKALQTYHFSRVPRHTWTNEEGEKNYPLARQGTGELVGRLKEKGWSDEEIKENISWYHFHHEKIDFGATLAGMLLRVYDDEKDAIEDYYANAA